MIPDQIKMWDHKHQKNDHEKLRGSPSPLAELAEPLFPRTAKVLELGCGVGRDALYFDSSDHEVLATDSSKVVIKQNQEQYQNAGVHFEVLDMQQLLPYKKDSFDVVYANLSLHYYLDDKTKEIIRNIAKVLKLGGILAFACKSRDDERSRGAEEVEKDVFVAPNGHVTHFFTLDYAKDLVDSLFEIVHLDEVDEVYDGHKSSIVRCVATKK